MVFIMLEMRLRNSRTALSVILALALILAPLMSAHAFSLDTPSEWAMEEVLKAREYGLIPVGMYHSFASNITRMEFCRLVMALYTKITGIQEQTNLQSVFIDTSNMSIMNAYELGIVKGIGGGYFSPMTPITRQEIAVMLFNAINAINSESGKDILGSATGSLAFSDRDQTAEWAIDAISSLRSNDIMLGDGRNRFNPLDNTTKEMAFILVNRIYLIYSGLDAKKAFPAAYTGDILMRIKGSFTSGDEYQIIGDVFEPYQGLAITDLEKYIDGEAFIDNNGELYYINRSESLSESIAAGYSGGQYYPVYVLVHDGSPRNHLYIINVATQYRVYMDSGRKEPYFQKTFSDVIFPVAGDTAITLSGSGSGAEWLSGGASAQGESLQGAAGAGNAAGAAGASGAAGAAGATVVAIGTSATIAMSQASGSKSLIGAAMPLVSANDGTPGEVTTTFSELRLEAPEQLSMYLWLVQLARGRVARLNALEF